MVLKCLAYLLDELLCFILFCKRANEDKIQFSITLVVTTEQLKGGIPGFFAVVWFGSTPRQASVGEHLYLREE